MPLSMPLTSTLDLLNDNRPHLKSLHSNETTYRIRLALSTGTIQVRQ